MDNIAFGNTLSRGFDDVKDEKAREIYKRLTKLLQTGVVVRQVTKSGFSTVKDMDQGKSLIGRLSGYKHAQNTIYADIMSQQANRMGRAYEYELMEQTAEIAASLDIYADESTTLDVHDNMIEVTCDDERIQEILENLFYDIINIKMHLWNTIRGMCKYGDYFWLLNIDELHGVIGFQTVDPTLIEREEGFDEKNPNAIKFNFLGVKQSSYNIPLHRQTDAIQNWQIAHFRLTGDHKYLPYGRSILEPVRKTWKQLILLEDAMLVYRITRAPERRVFKIDVGSLPPHQIPDYIKKVKADLKKHPVVDPSTGNVDLKFNVMALDEDYFIPVRGDRTTTAIETLPGAQNLGDIEDVEYMQKKLFTGLKIPKAYLANEQDLGAKATLSQEDVRFSRTIGRVQEAVQAELTKIAIVHLYILGFTDESLVNFQIQLNNPSTLAEQMMIDLMQKRIETAVEAKESGMYDRTTIMRDILKMSDDDIKTVNDNLILDSKFAFLLTSIGEQGQDPRANDVAAEQIQNQQNEFESNNSTVNNFPQSDVIKQKEYEPSPSSQGNDSSPMSIRNAYPNPNTSELYDEIDKARQKQLIKENRSTQKRLQEILKKVEEDTLLVEEIMKQQKNSE